MHSFLRKRNLLWVGLCALAVIAVTPPALLRPEAEAAARESAQAASGCSPGHSGP